MDTIFALSSGRPPAAVSVIRISGPQAHEAGERIAGTLPPARRAAVRALRNPSTGEMLDDALVLRFDAPATATGEDVVELQCHGGRAVVDAVLNALAKLEGLRQALPGEFTRRAFENGRIDLTEAEGLADLIEAETESQRKAALALAEGGLSRQISAWEDRLLSLSAEAERAIDYADDEDEVSVDKGLLRGCVELADELTFWLACPRMETLKDGVRIVVAGPPNAGKSSLINAIAGSEKAIVTEIPGTTRDQIEVPLALGGLPIVLTDTAGLRETDDVVEAIGVGRATAAAAGADVLLWMGEAGAVPQHPRTIVIHGRADLAGRGSAPAGSIAVSSVTGAGLPELLETARRLATEVLPREDAIAVNRRQAALIEEAHELVRGATDETDVVLIAERLRAARAAFHRLTGRAGFEDLLDALFSRFCLGK